MARSVYSTRFSLSSVAVPGPSTLYTVPAGHIAVLKDVDYYQTAGAASFLFIGEGTAALFPIALSTPAGVNSAQWRGRMVFQAGETIAQKNGGGTFSITLNGYLLTS